MLKSDLQKLLVMVNKDKLLAMTGKDNLIDALKSIILKDRLHLVLK